MKINPENTYVSLGLLITICGGVYFIATLESISTAHSARLDRQGVAVQRCEATIGRVDRRLSWIEGRLGKPKEAIETPELDP